MRLFIASKIDDGVDGGEAIRLAEFERFDRGLKRLNINLSRPQNSEKYYAKVFPRTNYKPLWHAAARTFRRRIFWF